MAKLENETGIDWTACELVERVPGKVSGAPIVKGTRILPDPIIRCHERGESLAEIQQACPRLRSIRSAD